MTIRRSPSGKSGSRPGVAKKAAPRRAGATGPPAKTLMKKPAPPHPPAPAAASGVHWGRYRSVGELVAELLREIDQGRSIIPIVGAGISADSGFPVLESVVRYFGKLRNYIQEKKWLPVDNAGRDDPLQDLREIYKKDNWKYVRDFGWPDRFRLTEDIVMAMRPSDSETVTDAVIEGLDKLLDESQNSAKRWFDDLGRKLRVDLGGKLSKDFNESLEGMIASKSKPAVRDHIAKQIQATLRKLRREFRARLQTKFKRTDENKHAAWEIFGDWRRMILQFTNYQSDYADALLDRFGRHRSPNLGHRYLAFLTRRLNIRAIFTMNFDQLIERALDDEGLQPQTFAMEHGLTLPHDFLVRDQLAVIKMHGSTHGLLLDEALDRPLSPDYLDRFSKIVSRAGTAPILFVIGCSGSDNRLLELLGQLLSRAKDSALRAIWLHYEPEAPKRVHEFAENIAAKGNKIKFLGTNNVGGTLQHIYSEIDKLHPSSRRFYLTHAQQPILHGDFWSGRDNDATSRLETALGSKRLLLLQSPLTSAAAKEAFPNPSASRQLLFLGNELSRKGYLLLWIDLEAIHSLSAVVGSIIEQCRKYDPALPPSALSLDTDENIIGTAVQRVARALRRGRYFVAFDGLETYIWSPTAHHGDTHAALRREERERLHALMEFLNRLSAEKRGESKLALSVDPPRTRTDWDYNANEVKEGALAKLKPGNRIELPIRSRPARFNSFFEPVAPHAGAIPLLLCQRCRPSPSAPADAVGDHRRAVRWALALAMLATFRRTRPLALVQQVLQPILGDEAEGFLTEHLAKNAFRQLEGGSIWFYRELRDHIYGHLTAQTSASALARFLTASPGNYVRAKTAAEFVAGSVREPVRACVCQLLLNACLHQLIARSWHAEAFLQSHDAFAMLEYIYHRLASIRSLTRLIGVAGCKGHAVAEDHVKQGIRDFEAFLDSAHDKDQLVELFELHSDFFKKNLADFETELVSRHKEELLRLQRTWKRSENLLRARLPAEQMVRWCEQLLGDDLKYRCDGVVLAYDETTGKETSGEVTSAPKVWGLKDAKKPRVYFHSTTKEEQLEKPPGALWQLREYISDFYAKILIDRSDYQGCIDFRDKSHTDSQSREPNPHYRPEFWDMLLRDKGEESTTPAVIYPGILGDQEKADQAAHLRRAHHSIDVLSCHCRLAQQDTCSVEDLRSGLPVIEGTRDREVMGTVEIMKILRFSRESRRQYLHDEAVPGLHEVWLRRLHLLTDCIFGRVAVFSHEGFSGGRAGFAEFKKLKDESNQEHDAFQLLERLIDDGSRLARLQTFPQTTNLHSPIVNAVTDGTLYLQYRAVFLIQRARYRWLHAVQKANAERNKLARTVLAKTVRNAFDEALRGFENARAGLGDTNHLTLASADLHAVEACLAHARTILHPDGIGQGDPKADPFGLARARHETARNSLARVQQVLLGAQRNLVWHRFYYRLATQYQADRLLMGLVNVYRRRPRSLGLYLQRLRQGYDTLRSTQDLYLRCDNNNLVWLARSQWELTLSAFAIGLIIWHEQVLAARKKSIRIKPENSLRQCGAKRTVVRYLVNQLQRLLVTAGLRATYDDQSPPDDLKKNCARVYDAVNDAETERLKAKEGKARDDFDAKGVRAKELRRKILDHADQPL